MKREITMYVPRTYYHRTYNGRRCPFHCYPLQLRGILVLNLE